MLQGALHHDSGNGTRARDGDAELADGHHHCARLSGLATRNGKLCTSVAWLRRCTFVLVTPGSMRTGGFARLPDSGVQFWSPDSRHEQAISGQIRAHGPLN